MDYYNFEGRVLSLITNLPISDAVISISKSEYEVNDIASLTDDNGCFSIDVPLKGDCYISVNAENYETYEIDITEKKDQFLEIYLD